MNFISLIGLVIYKTRYICNAICRRYERTLFRKVGSGTSIGEGGIFTYSTISIGKKCHIGKYACLQSAHGEIIIQDNVMLGPFVSIHGGNHVYDNIGVFMNSVKKEKGTATLYFASSFEYILNVDGKCEKVQDRARTEFIYIIDESLIGHKQNAIDFHCPNCNSPITNLGEKKCKYCGTAIVEVIGRIFGCDNIVRY